MSLIDPEDHQAMVEHYAETEAALFEKPLSKGSRRWILALQVHAYRLGRKRGAKDVEETWLRMGGDE